MKVGAGTTGIHQACDRAQTFRVTKKGPGSIEDMQNRNHIPTNDFLKGQIKNAFQNFSHSFTAIKITANIIERYAEALIMLSEVYQNKVNKDVIADGFICSGQHCMPSREGESTVSFRTMMHQCYTDISADQLTLMQQMTPHFIDIIKTRGEITFEELVAQQLHPGKTTIPRNELCRVRHWSEIVNHAFVVRKFEAKRLEASDEAKELRRQQNIVDKEVNRINKRAIAAENKRNETPEQKAFKNQQQLLKRQAKAAEVRTAIQFLAAKNIGGPVVMAPLLIEAAAVIHDEEEAEELLN